jgi:LAO/AO transport system kinase
MGPASRNAPSPNPTFPCNPPERAKPPIAPAAVLTYQPRMPHLPDTTADLVRRARSGERLAISRIITELERAGPDMPALISGLSPHLGHALVVGFTGPPGAGKSTLVDAYVRLLTAAGKTVGIIAVDPSSPLSGGAILGDRVRMGASLSDERVFMRSLASGGALGGLSPAAVRIIDAFDGVGKDVIVLETVGTGQNEIDVAEVADVRVVLAAPGLGDGIQAMKSGLLEIADILVVNQADRPGADETQQQLLSALSLRSSAPADVPVLKTVATTGAGVETLAATLATIGARRLQAPVVERRRRRARLLIARAAAAEIARAATSSDMSSLTDDVLSGRISALAAAVRLLQMP